MLIATETANPSVGHSLVNPSDALRETAKIVSNSPPTMTNNQAI
jgi:hypothetical protein